MVQSITAEIYPTGNHPDPYELAIELNEALDTTDYRVVAEPGSDTFELMYVDDS